MSVGRGLALLVPLASAGCGLLFAEPEGPGAPAPEREAVREAGARADDPIEGRADEPLPARLGTLSQERISVTLRRDELEIRLTPLDESVTRTAAPDTWERLSALAGHHRLLFRERTGSDAPFQLFLVAIHSENLLLPFHPEDLTLVSRGLRFRAVEIRSLTPGWDRQQVAPRETQLAVYAFPPDVDLEGVLEMEYRDVRSREWERILPAVQAERARIRARGGG